MATILESGLLTNFLYPLVLVFVLVFAILEKTKMFGEGKSQNNAIISLVIALIFVAAVYPVIIMDHLIQYMSVGIFIIFVVLMLWGFVSGNKDLTVTDDKGVKIHKAFAVLIFGSLIFAVLWATGFGPSVVDALSKIYEGLFLSGWSSAFWTNFSIIAIILIVVFVALKINPFKSKKEFSPWIVLKKK